MEIFEGHRSLFRPLARPTIVLGNFDGVHVGHQVLLERARERASSVDGDIVLFTFEPHPARVLSPRLAPPLITLTARKLELLADAGVTVCVLEPFTPELAELSVSDFHNILTDILGAESIVVGYNFTYGKSRSGDAKSLRLLDAETDIDVQIVPPVDVDGLLVSSTKIREFLTEGNAFGASTLLGRPYDMDGTVIRGAGRGRTIGVPTANINPSSDLLPGLGVYAVRLRRLDGSGHWRTGAANLGLNPTFETRNDPSLEVHLLDWEGDLYDARVRVEFIEQIRKERKFSGRDELITQIHRDLAAVREILDVEE